MVVPRPAKTFDSKSTVEPVVRCSEVNRRFAATDRLPLREQLMILAPNPSVTESGRFGGNKSGEGRAVEFQISLA